MTDILLSTARRRQLGVCGALLAVSVFAACDSNEPTSPAATPKATLGIFRLLVLLAMTTTHKQPARVAQPPPSGRKRLR